MRIQIPQTTLVKVKTRREDEPDQNNGGMEENGRLPLCPPQREEEESAGGVGTWEKTDSPATSTTTQQ